MDYMVVFAFFVAGLFFGSLAFWIWCDPFCTGKRLIAEDQLWARRWPKFHWRYYCYWLLYLGLISFILYEAFIGQQLQPAEYRLAVLCLSCLAASVMLMLTEANGHSGGA